MVVIRSTTTAARPAGEATYAYRREQARKPYDRVVDVGERSYLPVKDIAGEYAQRLRRLLGAIPARRETRCVFATCPRSG